MSETMGALTGIRVIDLSRVLGGPFCTQILADHGADVVKVEPPQGDETRGWGPPFQDGTASYFLGINRNKRGIALDLAKPQGREVLFRLLAQADVMIENFKTGTLERWGMGYDEVLKERFPRLIHSRISGFGADGPLGGFAGYDACVQAQSGLMSLNGEKGGEALRVGLPVVDLATGFNAAIGILMALNERQRSGRGQFIETTLYESGLMLSHPYATNFFLTGKAPTRLGNGHPNLYPYDQFPTMTKPIYLGCGNNRQFQRLCAEIGRPDLASDARFTDNADRVTNRAALRAELEGILASQDGDAVCARLLERGVPCGVVESIPDVLSHPHTKARGDIVEMEEYKGVANAIRMSRSPAALRRKPPRFGAANREVLEEAGYSRAEIDALVKSGIVFDEMRAAPAD
ncbi:MAG TPA: CaiB/BaiF CoA-transferase family protein [Stellaceae bacterium]|nr:CaiB/BaiF CoA-transferase family protein [Stellaceae bacterium]